jgi:hypothetical protein
MDSYDSENKLFIFMCSALTISYLNEEIISLCLGRNGFLSAEKNIMFQTNSRASKWRKFAQRLLSLLSQFSGILNTGINNVGVFPLSQGPNREGVSLLSPED